MRRKPQVCGDLSPGSWGTQQRRVGIGFALYKALLDWRKENGLNRDETRLRRPKQRPLEAPRDSDRMRMERALRAADRDIRTTAGSGAQEGTKRGQHVSFQQKGTGWEQGSHTGSLAEW